MSFKSFASLAALVILAIPTRAIIPGVPYYMGSFNSDSTPSGMCWTAASNTDGAAVTMQPCTNSGSASQSWIFTNGAPATPGDSATGTIKIFGNKCLDVTDGVDASGTKLQIAGCSTNNANQMWQVTTDEDFDIVQWANKTRCVDLTDGVETAGNPLQIWSCQNLITTHQQWLSQYAVPSPPANQPFRLYSALQKDRQLAVQATVAVDNAPVILGPTNQDSLPVDWAFDGTTLSPAEGFCLDVTNGADADGTKLQIYSCVSDNTNQEWVFNSNFSIQWKNHNKCLDLTDGNVANGNLLQIWTCGSGNAHQQWKIDPFDV